MRKRNSRPLPHCPDELALCMLLDDLPTKASTRDVAIFELLYGTGLRCGELARVNVDDIRLQDLWMRVHGKGMREREIPITKHAAAAVEAYLPDRRPGLNETAFCRTPHSDRSPLLIGTRDDLHPRRSSRTSQQGIQVTLGVGFYERF